MSLPGYSAEVSMYSSTHHYRAAWTFGRTAGLPAGVAQPAALPLPNGDGFCKPHIGPCTRPDPDCPSGKSRFIQTADCDGDTVWRVVQLWIASEIPDQHDFVHEANPFDVLLLHPGFMIREFGRPTHTLC